MTPKDSWKHVTPIMIKKVLKGVVALSGENLGFLPKRRLGLVPTGGRRHGAPVI